MYIYEKRDIRLVFVKRNKCLSWIIVSENRMRGAMHAGVLCPGLCLKPNWPTICGLFYPFNPSTQYHLDVSFWGLGRWAVAFAFSLWGDSFCAPDLRGALSEVGHVPLDV